MLDDITSQHPETVLLLYPTSKKLLHNLCWYNIYLVTHVTSRERTYAVHYYIYITFVYIIELASIALQSQIFCTAL